MFYKKREPIFPVWSDGLILGHFLFLLLDYNYGLFAMIGLTFITFLLNFSNFEYGANINIKKIHYIFLLPAIYMILLYISISFVISWFDDGKHQILWPWTMSAAFITIYFMIIFFFNLVYYSLTSKNAATCIDIFCIKNRILLILMVIFSFSSTINGIFQGVLPLIVMIICIVHECKVMTSQWRINNELESRQYAYNAFIVLFLILGLFFSFFILCNNVITDSNESYSISACMTSIIVFLMYIYIQYWQYIIDQDDNKANEYQYYICYLLIFIMVLLSLISINFTKFTLTVIYMVFMHFIYVKILKNRLLLFLTNLATPILIGLMRLWLNTGTGLKEYAGFMFFAIFCIEVLLINWLLDTKYFDQNNMINNVRISMILYHTRSLLCLLSAIYISYLYDIQTHKLYYFFPLCCVIFAMISHYTYIKWYKNRICFFMSCNMMPVCFAAMLDGFGVEWIVIRWILFVLWFVELFFINWKLNVIYFEDSTTYSITFYYLRIVIFLSFSAFVTFANNTDIMWLFPMCCVWLTLFSHYTYIKLYKNRILFFISCNLLPVCFAAMLDGFGVEWFVYRWILFALTCVEVLINWRLDTKYFTQIDQDTITLDSWVLHYMRTLIWLVCSIIVSYVGNDKVLWFFPMCCVILTIFGHFIYIKVQENRLLFFMSCILMPISFSLMLFSFGVEWIIVRWILFALMCVELPINLALDMKYFDQDYKIYSLILHYAIFLCWLISSIIVSYVGNSNDQVLWFFPMCCVILTIVAHFIYIKVEQNRLLFFIACNVMPICFMSMLFGFAIEWIIIRWILFSLICVELTINLALDFKYFDQNDIIFSSILHYWMVLYWLISSIIVSYVGNDKVLWFFPMCCVILTIVAQFVYIKILVHRLIFFIACNLMPICFMSMLFAFFIEWSIIRWILMSLICIELLLIHWPLDTIYFDEKEIFSHSWTYSFVFYYGRIVLCLVYSAVVSYVGEISFYFFPIICFVISCSILLIEYRSTKTVSLIGIGLLAMSIVILAFVPEVPIIARAVLCLMGSIILFVALGVYVRRNFLTKN